MSSVWGSFFKKMYFFPDTAYWELVGAVKPPYLVVSLVVED